ncbi:MAG: NADH-quinone oxidoreductase subunit J [Epsilonproteobacteria bacterium]|nr:NADH-quinone oxidoreductase subunit J [Campylobacterota bacterium]
MIDTIFLILASFALFGAGCMIMLSNTVHSALGFIVTILALAGLYALLDASFLFMVQIIVYAGAIIALLLFVIMFLNIQQSHAPKEPSKYLFMVVSAIIMMPVDYLLFKAFYTITDIKNFSVTPKDFGDVKMLGGELFRNWLLPFEAISLLLLVALIGAVVMARKKERA